MPIEVNSIVEGKVSRIFKSGAIISLPENKEGFLHISEVSEKYVESIGEFLTEGQLVTVKIVSIDEIGKIRVSIRRAGKTFRSNKFSMNEVSYKSSNPNSQANKLNSSMTFEARLAEYLKVSSENALELSRSVESKVGGKWGSRKGKSKKSGKKK